MRFTKTSRSCRGDGMSRVVPLRYVQPCVQTVQQPQQESKEQRVYQFFHHAELFPMSGKAITEYLRKLHSYLMTTGHNFILLI